MMNEETMYTMKVGCSAADAVRVPIIYRTAESAERDYKKFYEDAFGYYAISGEPVH